MLFIPSSLPMDMEKSYHARMPSRCLLSVTAIFDSNLTRGALASAIHSPFVHHSLFFDFASTIPYLMKTLLQIVNFHHRPVQEQGLIKLGLCLGVVFQPFPIQKSNSPRTLNPATRRHRESENNSGR